jgi:tetratricopeptide (TPR) repeat protein
MSLSDSIPAALKSPFTTAEEVPLRRFLERMVGEGFAMVVIFGERQNALEEVVEWLETESDRLQAQMHKINLSRFTFNNPWLELDHTIGKKPSSEKNILLLHGIDPRSDLSRASEVRLFRQLNVQRDSLTRDYPCCWVLLVPPRLEHPLKTQAPDFCDFVGYWCTLTPGETPAERSSPSFTTTPSPSPSYSGTPESDARLVAALGNELLFGALKATWEWRLDEARGLLARYELSSRQNAHSGALTLVKGFLKFREGDKLQAEKLFAAADTEIDEEDQPQESVGEIDKALVHFRSAHFLAEQLNDVRAKARAMVKIAYILQQRGYTDEALQILREQAPVSERLGDVRPRAITMGQIADILQQRGQTDEALRIRREEELPVYERLGDVRTKAVTIGNIADILQQRGQTKEALRIRREEELPVYERLGDERAKAVTMGRIADILQKRGQTDEALRIRREEELPVYERLGDVRTKAVTIGNIAHILLQRGQTDEALRIYREEALPVYERLGDLRNIISARANLGIILLTRSSSTLAERQEAREHLLWALAEAEKRQYQVADQLRGIVKRLIPGYVGFTSPAARE